MDKAREKPVTKAAVKSEKPVAEDSVEDKDVDAILAGSSNGLPASN